MLTKTRSHQAGSVHIVLIVGAVLLLVTAIGWFTYNRMQYTQKVNKERALYAAADKEAKAYIDAIAEKYPGKITHNNECSYTSEIYSKGFLGCSTETKIDIVIDNNLDVGDMVSFADKQTKKIAWEETYHSEGPGPTAPNEIKAYIYKLEDKACSAGYSYKDVGSGANRYDLILDEGNKIFEIRVGCSGPALSEYY